MTVVRGSSRGRDDLLSCQYCGATIKAKKLDKHLSIHQRCCPICSRPVTSSTLDDHLIREHSVRTTECRPVVKKQQLKLIAFYECVQCHEEFEYPVIVKHLKGNHTYTAQKGKPGAIKETSNSPRPKVQPEPPPAGTKPCPFCKKYYAPEKFPDHFRLYHGKLPPGLVYLRLRELMGEKEAEKYRPETTVTSVSKEADSPSKTYILNEFGNPVFISGSRSDLKRSMGVDNTSRQAPGPKRIVHKVQITVHCPICGQGVNTEELSKHYESDHHIRLINSSPTKSKKPAFIRFECLICHRTLLEREALSHVQEHSDINEKNTAEKSNSNQVVMKKGASERQAPTDGQPRKSERSNEIKHCPYCGSAISKTKLLSHVGNEHEGLCFLCNKPYTHESIREHLLWQHGFHLLGCRNDDGKTDSQVWVPYFHCDYCFEDIPRKNLRGHRRTCHQISGHRPTNQPKNKAKNTNSPKKEGGERGDARSQSTHSFEDGGTDGGKYLGLYRREGGQFGSLPEYDDYGDEAEA